MSTQGRTAMNVGKKIHDKRPTYLEYALRVLRYMFTLSFPKALFCLFVYYVLNHVQGMCTAHMGTGARLWPTVLLRNAERLYIGDNTTINHNTILWAGRESAVIRIGNNVMMGPNVQIIAYNHFVEQGVPLSEHFTEEDIIIEDNVWLGAGVTVLAGARVGQGTVVGAGAVVVGELPRHSVCAGVPARVVKTL